MHAVLHIKSKPLKFINNQMDNKKAFFQKLWHMIYDRNVRHRIKFGCFHLCHDCFLIYSDVITQSRSAILACGIFLPLLKE